MEAQLEFTVEINQYIKDLLLLNDCVIIPEFGGFVSNYRPAVIKHNRFSPPSKEIAFNPKLQNNDGLLINYISETEGIGYFDAKQKVEAFVDESLLRLENYERIVFDAVGQLYYDQKENLLFEPCNDLNLLVDSYGLESFSYEKLYQRMVPEPAMKLPKRESVQVLFSKRQVKKVLIGVPLVLALALIPLKENKTILNTSDLNLLDDLTETIAPAVVEEIKEETAVFEEEVTVQEATPIHAASNDKYFIIGGSFRSEENAKIFMDEQRSAGFEPLDLGVFNGLHRISLESFSDYQLCQQELKALRKINPGVGF